MMTVYEVQIWRGATWTRWGVYLYAALAERVQQRREQEGLTARTISWTIDS